MASKVSIIMPVFNAQEYVSTAIQSVVNQEYTEWELLIVNDGSTDNSEVVIKKFHDTRIKYFSKLNEGVSSARNLALIQMSGDYFCFLDADDSLPVKSLSSRLQIFSDPEVCFVDGTINIYDEQLNNKVNQRIQTFSGKPMDALCGIDTSCFFGPSWMIRNIAGIQYKFDESLTHGEDLYFYMTIAHLGKYKTTSDVIYNYRSGHTSAMSNLDGLNEGYLRIYKGLKDLSTCSIENAEIFRKKTRSIMFKSFLAKFKVVSAMNSWIEFSKI